VVLGAVYMLFLVERVFFGPLRNEANAKLPDLSVREGFVLAPMVVLIVVMGLMPRPFLAPVQAPVDRLVARLAEVDAKAGRVARVGTVPPAISVRGPRGPTLADPPPGGVR
jgi:NADH-quinone oxidoreductase subunit M